MSPETKVTEANQTQVPAALRTKYGVGPGDVLVWEETADGEVRVRFRHRHRLEDLIGLVKRSRGGDAVRDKKRAQRREM
ncbi:MAG TPA: AbrB/MazE/SpoVT family DNA-binding domain-containing protein [Candidatus Thermoplasmatota archaeon]|nr:AbrB/MazE/SpoVT family DNA-binding domain-containing protein [Candidatus Thermoplasmatota archaeon]